MSEEVKTISGVGCLMMFRDQLKQQAIDILEKPTKDLEEAKAKFHSAKIASNQLLRKAAIVQDSITLELQLKYDEEEKAKQAYEYKGDHEMEELYK